MQQLVWCQIARSIHYTSTIIVRLPEEANSQAQSLLVCATTVEVVCTTTRNRMEERLHSYFILKCDKAIFNTFGSLRGFSHVIMEVDCMEHSLNSGSYPVTNRSAR